MNKCLVCDKNIEDTFNSLINVYSICYSCLNNFKIRNKKFFISGVKGMILYYYDEFFKNVLYKYKGLGDYPLKDVFLNFNVYKLRRKYKRYTIVLAPSNKSLEKKRGFNHLEEIFKSLNIKVIKCFYKCEEWKQSDKNLKERENIQNIIKIDKSMLDGVKRVLIVDDVLTSGSTIKAMISQIPTNIDKKVLILSSNCRILKNEIV